MHSSEFPSGKGYAGKKAVVFGAGNSGHDVAQDLHAHGAEVTLVQRGPTTEVSIEPSSLLLFQLYTSDPALEDCDLLAMANPYPVAIKVQQEMTRVIREMDRDLISNLEAAGFKTDYGVDNTGFAGKNNRTGGGYCFNTGCSDFIIKGEIGIRQHDEVSHINRDGLVLKDGQSLEADIIVFATGYKSLSTGVARYFGDEIAARVGEVWGYGPDGEIRNVWKRTPQPGLWFIAGGFPQARMFSKLLALQIKACEERIIFNGLNDGAVPRRELSSQT